MVICLERGADLHMAQLMPLPLTVSCFSKIQISFTFLVPAHLGSPGKRAVKWVCGCVLVSTLYSAAAAWYSSLLKIRPHFSFFMHTSNMLSRKCQKRMFALAVCNVFMTLLLFLVYLVFYKPYS